MAEQDEPTCEHGTAMDVHCCNCHSGFIFDKDHECPPLTCERAGCNAEPMGCYLPGEDAKVHEWLCRSHPVEAGYCCGCGMFIAGSDELFDSGRSGQCEHCRADSYENVDDEAEDYGDESDPEEDDYFDCHMGPDGSCGLAGTEECDWDCPYGKVKKN